MKEIIISQNEAGQRVNKFLLKYLNKAPSSFVLRYNDHFHPESYTPSSNNFSRID